MTLLQTQLVAELAREFPGGVAWRNLADGSEITVDQWHRRSNCLARGLKELGLRRGDRVALLISNEEPLEWLVSYLAIHKAGAVAVPLLARLAPSELARILCDAGASVVLCSDLHAELRDVVPTVISTRATGSPRWSDLLLPDDTDVQEAFGPDDVADIMYTSGTTGRPKGVVVRHGGLSTMEHVPSTWLGLGFISCSPFATTSGSLLICGPLRGGVSGWFLPRFDPETWIATVERDRPVAGFLVPAMVELIVGSPRFETADLSSLAAVNVGSAPIAAATLRRFAAGLPAAEILCGYGMTEFGAVTAMPMGDAGTHLGSVGVPLPGVELRIVGPDGATLPPGVAGQVAIGGARSRRAYLGDPDERDQTWVDGWLMSGDLGYVDTDGHLWIVGRDKEIIIRGGHNVVPGEVESVLFEHPAVAEAAVAGVAHPVLGQDVAAWVVLRRPASMDELRAFLLARLADFKVPRRITAVGALPRNESGKILKSQLTAEESRSAQ
jgi:acyl-CoA synthetase (AMP-forming)/AMP-acid ligase II